MKKILSSLILLFIAFSLVRAQGTMKVNGTVVGSDGDPLIGVSVKVKQNTSINTITDLDGKFELTIETKGIEGKPILVFFFVGLKTQEAEAMQDMRIILEEEVHELLDVAITGYRSVKKRELAASVVSVKRETMPDGKKKSTTWKRSGMPDNSLRLQVGDDDYIPAEAIQMAVQVDGFRVRVLMDCFFFNNKKDGVEGTFKLKLPNGATPYYFAFGETKYIDEVDEDERRLLKGKIPYIKYDYKDFDLEYKYIDEHSREWENVKKARIVSKQKAAKAYEDIVSANIDPALMEWGGSDMFSCRVFPLVMNTLHRVVIGYDLDMTEALDFREYIMALPKTDKELVVDMCIYKSPNLPLIIQPALQPVSELEGRVFYSLVNPKEKEINISYNTVKPIMLTQKNDGEDFDDSYFASNYRVSLPESPEKDLPGDAVFVLDVSLSSNPDKFNVWLKLMQEILEQNKDIIKRFAVLTFNVETRWYAKYYQKNNYYNVSKMFEYANTLALEGATDIGTALKEASNPSWLKKNSPKHIFLMSDADCNWGETNKHTYKYLINKDDRVHTYRTGLSGTNIGVLDYLSRTTGGYSFTVTGEEEAELTAKSFRYKPWNVEKIEVEGVDDFLISGNPTQLYNGQKLLFTGRGVPTGKITIEVNNGIEKNVLMFDVDAVENISSVLTSRVYGQIAMSYLDNYGYKAEESAINYSTYYCVPGQYTSFLMLENSYDYDEYGAIDYYDARDFVDDYEIHDLVDALDGQEETVSLGNPKADFLAWLETLQGEKSIVRFDPSDEFQEYIKGLPDEVFKIGLPALNCRLYMTEQQTSDEQDAIGSEDVRFDRLYSLARKRRSSFGKEDGLKLLSSVIEKNASDVQTVRDVAMIATDWGLGGQAYYMMRRIIEWRQGEAISYLTAADALGSTINNIDMALIYYYICLNSDWDSDYGSFTEIAALRCLRYLNKIKDDPKIRITKHTQQFIDVFREEVESELDSKDLLFNEADIVVITNWNVDNTDVDLHVLEPTGETCYYGNKNTEIGGRLTIDVTDGYGPEMYVLRDAPAGIYKVMLNYYRSSRTKTASKAKVYIDVYQNWGRKDEKVSRKTVLLDKVKDKETVFQFKIRDKK